MVALAAVGLVAEVAGFGAETAGFGAGEATAALAPVSAAIGPAPQALSSVRHRHRARVLEFFYPIAACFHLTSQHLKLGFSASTRAVRSATGELAGLPAAADGAPFPISGPDRDTWLGKTCADRGHFKLAHPLHQWVGLQLPWLRNWLAIAWRM